MTSEIRVCLRINAPEWYQRDDFQDFLNGRVSEETRPASWHKPGEDPHEYSDIFVTYSDGEGSDTQEIPKDIWQQICDAANHHGVTDCLVWISNLEALDDVPCWQWR